MRILKILRQALTQALIGETFLDILIQSKKLAGFILVQRVKIF